VPSQRSSPCSRCPPGRDEGGMGACYTPRVRPSFVLSPEASWRSPGRVFR
jgi:hypothetical protein